MQLWGSKEINTGKRDWEVEQTDLSVGIVQQDSVVGPQHFPSCSVERMAALAINSW